MRSVFTNGAEELKKNIAEWTIYIVFLEGNTVKIKSPSYMLWEGFFSVEIC